MPCDATVVLLVDHAGTVVAVRSPGPTIEWDGAVGAGLTDLFTPGAASRPDWVRALIAGPGDGPSDAVLAWVRSPTARQPARLERLGREADGTAVGVVLLTPWPQAARDITDAHQERERAERRARDLEHRLETFDGAAGGPFGELWERASQGWVVTDADGIVLRANPAFSLLVDRPEASLVGVALDEVYDASDNVALRAYAARLRNGELDLLAQAARVRRRDGSWLRVRSVVGAVRDADGGFAGAFVGCTPFARSLAVSVDPTEELRALRTRAADLERALWRIAGVVEGVAVPAGGRAGRRGWVDSADLGALTARELEIVGMLSDGLRPPSIGRALHLSASTVRSHLSVIFRKLGVASQEELLARLREL